MLFQDVFLDFIPIKICKEEKCFSDTFIYESMNHPYHKSAFGNTSFKAPYTIT